MHKQFFIDFDGTVTTKDTVAAMVESFAREGWQELNEKWEKKEMSTEECARRTLKLFDTDPAELEKLLDTISIDKYFPDFLTFCQNKGYQVYILSDGYDFNIKHILNRYKINIPYYCNKLIYSGHFDIECINTNENCDSCGTCKTNLMQQLHIPGCQSVYIGDGYSDTCPAEHADVVFAKSSLLKFSREHGINAIAFGNFDDIIKHLKNKP